LHVQVKDPEGTLEHVASEWQTEGVFWHSSMSAKKKVLKTMNPKFKELSFSAGVSYLKI